MRDEDFGEEKTMEYGLLGYGPEDVGHSEITVRRLPSGQMEVVVVRHEEAA